MNWENTKVISNTTPIIALSALGKLDLLKELYGSVTIAQSVQMEIQHGGAIEVPDLKSLPWITVVDDIRDIKERLIFGLDEGEKQTILAALSCEDNCLVLMDERKGRKVASNLKLKITGTLGILAEAKRKGLIGSFREYADKLLGLNFYYDIMLIEAISQEVDK